MKQTSKARTARRTLPTTQPRARSRAVLGKLGDLPIAQFMREHWQRRPLLVRDALPMNTPLVSWADMAEFATRDDVESRLVKRGKRGWDLTHGPIAMLPKHTQRNWTLLVQGVDLHSDLVHDLLARFRFVPDARLDDVMVSIASDGGGVGPHWDSYDVFLLQLEGRRRWRVGPTGYPENPPACIPDLPLKIIADPVFDSEYLLEPGDMLYLPPGWAHDGVALGPCTTLSVGFRTPGHDELLAAWLNDQSDRLGSDTKRYRDPGIAATSRPGEIPPRLAATMSGWLRAWRPTREDVEDFIGRHLSEPKPGVWFEAPQNHTTVAGFSQRVLKNGLRLDRKTRMLYRGPRLFMNGERINCELSPILKTLVNQRRLSAVVLAKSTADPALTKLLYQWWTLGWLTYS